MKKTLSVFLAFALFFSPLGLLPLPKREEAEHPPTLPPPQEELFPNIPVPEPLPEEPETPQEPPLSQEPPTALPEEPEIPQEPSLPQEPPEEGLPLRAQYVYVAYDGVNVRTGAGTQYASLGQVEKGVLLHLEEKSGGWYQTYYQNRTAYISANSLYTSVALLDKGQEDVENVIEEGLRLLGVPYVYGAVRLHDGKGNFLRGFTVKKFDCSSLMQYIFYEGAGVLLNTTTRTQVSQGKRVDGKLQRGDLLFFTNDSRYHKTGIERVGHVALYLGDNYILHTASDYAKIEQISAKRWSYFLSARRFF